MKTKLSLFLFLASIFIAACNQPKKVNEKESEAIEVHKEEATEPVTIKGKIVNKESGDGVSMTMIIVKGTTTGTMSGPNGEFMIQAPVGAKKLVFSANGFETFEADIDSEKEMEVKLIPKK
jgi:hypothetical protein